MDETAICAEKLTKVYRDFWGRPKVWALRGVDFEVRRGEVFGLLGPNGSGKSTTIKIMLGLLHATGGRISVLGRSPRDVKVKARIGYLPEESYLHRYLTPDETLDFYGALFNLSRAVRRERAEQLLAMTGLTDARSRTVDEFSKGMARRLGVAQALINDPDLILLDEPTSGLDPIGCRQMKDLILTLARRGKTIVLSSHLLADVEDVCDRIAILHRGTLCASGRVDDLLKRPDSVRFTIPAVGPEALRALARHLAEVVGQEPRIDHPSMNLEQFFLEVVEKAQQEASPAAGARASGGRVASFLSGPPEQPGNPPEKQ